MKSPCFDCPWSEPGNREDMIALLDAGEALWPCHNTAVFSKTDDGMIVGLKKEPGNRMCFGYLAFIEGLRG